MPEIKIKHVVSFSSEDKVHKAENLLKEETYRKWKCASPGEKNATIVLQFEKATKIHSIDIGNEGSAFIEVLVGRSSDSVNDYQVLLVASSFMSPLESRNGTHMNRVRMFGPEKLSQNVKDEKWDCVQIVCTQPFNKNIQYGLTFIRFHSPPEKIEEQPNTEKPVTKLGAFKLKDDDEEDSLPSPGSWFGKQRTKASDASASTSNQSSPSYATAVLTSSNNVPKDSFKRKADQKNDVSQEPPSKKVPLNKDHIVYKDMDSSVRGSPQSAKAVDSNKNVKATPSPSIKEKKKDIPATTNVKDQKKDLPSTPTSSKQSANNNNTPARTLRQKVPFNKIMDRVVFVLSGFVNPLRSDLREKALEMGAKYKPDWDDTCTHLVCAFAKTPKYDQVKKVNGRIVKKEWILDCYKKKEPILWRKYELSSGDSSDEQDDSDKDPNYKDDGGDDDDDSDVELIEDSDEEKKGKRKPQTLFQRKRATKAADSPNKKKPQSPRKQTAKTTDTSSSSNLPRTLTKKQSNISDSEDEADSLKLKDCSSVFNKMIDLQQNSVSDNSQSPAVQRENESETEDEDAIQDYVADTDVEDDSGGDTEDEIRKAENKLQKKKTKVNGSLELSEKPDVSDLPLPELPDFFKKKHFFLYGDFSPSNLHKLQRYITAYNGVLEDYMSGSVKYVITEKKWDSNFDDALSANEDLIFVKPTWIYKCHEAGKLVPYQPHIVIPDS